MRPMSPFKIYQHVDITVLRLLAADVGAEDAQLPKRISPPQLRLQPAQLRDDLVQRFHPGEPSYNSTYVDSSNVIRI